jgi:uncharacterized protein (TIGR03437 family)
VFITSFRFGMLVLALSLIGESALEAAVIPVFGTGVSADNTPLTGGLDPHYTVTYGDATGPAVVDSFHGDGATTNPNAEGPWVANQPDAVWVSTANAQGGLPSNVAVYYTTKFDLTGLDPNSVSITISWAVDDSGSQGVFLNGVAIPGSAAPRNTFTPLGQPWAHFTSFTLSSKQQVFNAGINTLSFVQDPSDGFIDGVIVEISGTANPISGTGSAPSIKSVVPIFSSSTTIQPGSWVSIFGTNLSTGTAVWDGSFPTTLGGTSVTINSKPAYLWYVSPGQLNVQAPDDSATGSVPVVVTTNGNSATSTVTLATFSPSFSVLDGAHVAGIIYRPDGSGAYGGGAYDIIGPTGGSLGYPTVAAKAGDTVALFGVGFGPTDPEIPAGHSFLAHASTMNPVAVQINGVAVVPSFSGMTAAGLYQMDLTIPSGVGTGDKPLIASVGGLQTQPNVVITLQ